MIGVREEPGRLCVKEEDHRPTLMDAPAILQAIK